MESTGNYLIISFTKNPYSLARNTLIKQKFIPPGKIAAPGQQGQTRLFSRVGRALGQGSEKACPPDFTAGLGHSGRKKPPLPGCSSGAEA
jgi:hypothetical protein